MCRVEAYMVVAIIQSFGEAPQYFSCYFRMVYMIWTEKSSGYGSHPASLAFLLFEWFT
jgi:hypothetical protein